MEVEVANVVFKDTAELQFTQSAPDEDCTAPLVHVKGGKKYPNAMEFSRSTFFELFGITELGCVDTLQNNKVCRAGTLKPQSWHNANFVTTGGTVGCRYDNPPCRQWKQVGHLVSV